MYNTRSDYALNKRDHDAIVFASATGEIIRLTREDFATDAEFERWKEWSDADYHASERRDKAYSDRKYALSQQFEPTVEGSEAQFFAAIEECKDGERVRLLRNHLTDRQFTRVYKRFGLGMSVTDIAAEDGVSKSAVMASLRSAQAALRKVVCEDNRDDR